MKYDEVGNTSKEDIEQLQRANLLNSVQSKAIALMNLTLIPGTDLYEEAKRGDFIEASEKEKLIEEKTLIENLNLKDDTLFSSIHMSNIESLNGTLPRDKEYFIDRLNKVIPSF